MLLGVRNSVKILLMNEKKEILLMCADDPTTTSMEGKYHGRFWFPIGGKIELGESIQEAALRELYEETGITQDKIELGPIVWFGEFDLILAGRAQRLNEKFIVATTKQTNISLDNLTDEERAVVKNIAWFSLDTIKKSTEVIFPILLPQYLPDILAGRYPAQPIEIDLARQPA
ncbi:MAG: NUDIX domain-containing protein [Candidatus Babeliales bacterium]|jgi:8-oxo-dGTP pyrophosphatase MutT (NUDIX family)